MSKRRLTLDEIEEFIDLYLKEGTQACADRFEMSLYHVSEEAAILNLPENPTFNDYEQGMTDRYAAHLGTAMIFILTQRRPEEFKGKSFAS